jgi:hypothetical protein
MEIDLAQLPVPDWPLNCPRCGYPLRGLPEHRCPECGEPFDVQALTRPWTRLRDPRFTGHELPLPDFGLTCAACGGPLAGATQRSCALCQAPFDPESYRPREPWFVLDGSLCRGVPVSMVQMLLTSEQLPHLPVGEMTIGEIYGGQTMMVQRLRVPREFFFEVLWLIREAQRDIAAVRARGPQQEWHCGHCGAGNPGHFEVCWNCQRPKSSAHK